MKPGAKRAFRRCRYDRVWPSQGAHPPLPAAWSRIRSMTRRIHQQRLAVGGTWPVIRAPWCSPARRRLDLRRRHRSLSTWPAAAWPIGLTAQTTSRAGHRRTCAGRGAGAAWTTPCACVAYVPERADVPAVAAVLKERLGAARPANTTVCCPLVVDGALVEIEITALRRRGGPGLNANRPAAAGIARRAKSFGSLRACRGRRPAVQRRPHHRPDRPERRRQDDACST